MTCYLLDTNILIAAANDTSAILNSHLAKHTNDELFTSSLSWMEIYHGILKISPEPNMIDPHDLIELADKDINAQSAR